MEDNLKIKVAETKGGYNIWDEGEKIKIEDFYKDLYIPSEKIKMNEEWGTIVMPYFLYREVWGFRIEEGNLSKIGVNIITIDEYPLGSKKTVRLPTRSVFADKTEPIKLTRKKIKYFLSQGYEWLHVTEKIVLWETEDGTY